MKFDFESKKCTKHRKYGTKRDLYCQDEIFHTKEGKFRPLLAKNIFQTVTNNSETGKKPYFLPLKPILIETFVFVQNYAIGRAG